jgi:hypothetical protein
VQLTDHSPHWSSVTKDTETGVAVGGGPGVGKKKEATRILRPKLLSLSWATCEQPQVKKHAIDGTKLTQCAGKESLGTPPRSLGTGFGTE